ncbi:MULTISPECIES: O-methyltransferase [Chryseobacterium]|uniref:O-methyltransferase YrrM n=1 Tax=Chryseobacterium camelliae TaxID=1265445 RepID=A0ABU0TH14_9FLAO|nr:MULTISPECIES: class I SAM-dependent methyltransferase [Chryseobacterium]MDT3405852.1 putative O-methyltransferase YrrM [Pseudacidovorax intermedius]MDQ1096341.1 putative O-methyltransferase YrrM [Chryseobacterium camelliae]MDQ1100280.1 putative O-methyltransferase YrrM [Chryseobacterium sp. SORGH_AS_1048]MDR6087623.1 putative O-methyltransferase YrrM [Chryseobacterium sp. SORGH_AS_0909]MDR6131997.1 putative O-methyltransferase YrrM [Chryseobacterium sp. SORGH_AS_1175]
MNPKLKNEILQLYRTLKEEDNTKENRLDRWRNLEPESAEFISIIIKGQNTRHMLELGTSNGFSTLWFADALKNTGGKLITVEIDPQRTQLAKDHLAAYSIQSDVEFITGDAKEYLHNADPFFNIIFLDAERRYYTDYWKDLKRLLSFKGSMLIVDNVVSHRNEVQGFIGLIEQEQAFSLSILPIGAGLLLVTKD